MGATVRKGCDTDFGWLVRKVTAIRYANMVREGLGGVFGVRSGQRAGVCEAVWPSPAAVVGPESPWEAHSPATGRADAAPGGGISGNRGVDQGTGDARERARARDPQWLRRGGFCAARAAAAAAAISRR